MSSRPFARDLLFSHDDKEVVCPVADARFILYFFDPNVQIPTIGKLRQTQSDSRCDVRCEVEQKIFDLFGVFRSRLRNEVNYRSRKDDGDQLETTSFRRDRDLCLHFLARCALPRETRLGFARVFLYLL